MLAFFFDGNLAKVRVHQASSNIVGDLIFSTESNPRGHFSKSPKHEGIYTKILGGSGDYKRKETSHRGKGGAPGEFESQANSASGRGSEDPCCRRSDNSQERSSAPAHGIGWRPFGSSVLARDVYCDSSL